MNEVDHLVSQLRHADYHVRAAAIEALGKSAEARAVPALLGVIGDRAEGDGEHAVNLRAGIALAAFGERALAPSIAALRPDPGHRDDGWRRYWLARALALHRDPRVLPPLIGLLDDENPSAVEGAVDALTALRRSIGLGALQSAAVAAVRRAQERFGAEDSYLTRLLRDTVKDWSTAGRRQGRSRPTRNRV